MIKHIIATIILLILMFIFTSCAGISKADMLHKDENNILDFKGFEGIKIDKQIEQIQLDR